MFLTNHTLTGVALGLGVDEPLVLAPIAFGSHFVLDGLPHFGPKKKRGFGSTTIRVMAGVDMTISLVLYLLALHLWPERKAQITIAVFFACLPDLLYIPREFWHWTKPAWLFRLHKKVQWSETPPGAIAEVIWAGLMAALISKKH